MYRSPFTTRSCSFLPYLYAIFNILGPVSSIQYPVSSIQYSQNWIKITTLSVLWLHQAHLSTFDNRPPKTNKEKETLQFLPPYHYIYLNVLEYHPIPPPSYNMSLLSDLSPVSCLLSPTGRRRSHVRGVTLSEPTTDWKGHAQTRELPRLKVGFGASSLMSTGG